MTKNNGVSFTFFECFALILIISSFSSFLFSCSFDYRFLIKLSYLLYIAFIIILVFIILFNFKGSYFLYLSVFVIFSFFYPLSRYGTENNLKERFKIFRVGVIGEIGYRNNRTTFEGVLINKNKKRYLFTGKKVIISTDSIYPDIFRGCIIEGEGTINLIDKEKSNYNLYLFSRGIDYSLNMSNVGVIGNLKTVLFYRAISGIKRYISKICNLILPYPHSTFAIALLTGNRKEMPGYLTAIFKRTGTLHVLAISGLHVGFIAGILIMGLSFLGLRHILLYSFAAVFIIAYALFIGKSPSVIRASMMFSSGVLLYILDRDRDYINLISVIFVIIVLYNPRVMLNPGFLLSFLATFGILFSSSEIKELMFNYLPRYLSLLLSMSVSATIYTFPVMITYFGKFPYISILANIIIIPATAVVLFLSMFMVIIYPIFLPLANLIAYLNGFFISLIFSVNVIFSRIPPFSLNFGNPNNIIVFTYCGVITYILYLFLKSRKPA